MLNDDHILSLSVSNLHNGIRLVDSEALACITSFCFPSAAASVQCLAWVPSAPGMFITGGKVCVRSMLPYASMCLLLLNSQLLLVRLVFQPPTYQPASTYSQLVCRPCCCHSAICVCRCVLTGILMSTFGSLKPQ